VIDLNALPWKDYITLGAALLGAVLGIMNTWNAMSARRVRLRVRPVHAFPPSGEPMFAIEVLNLSNFELTVDEVGFTLNGNKLKKGRRAAIPRPIVIDGEPWPRRLKPRESVSLYFHRPDPSEPIGKAYASTACGEVRYGDSPALWQLRSERLR
jgi:hypothetical protein